LEFYLYLVTEQELIMQIWSYFMTSSNPLEDFINNLFASPRDTLYIYSERLLIVLSEQTEF